MRGRVLGAGEFFRELPAALAQELPANHQGFATRRGPGRLLKVDYGHPETHYEAWHHGRSGRLEVGLHCEGRPQLNQRALAFLAPRLLEIKADLFRAELEPWDRGWCRLYETLPALALSEGVLAEAARLLAAYVVALQPLMERFWLEEAMR